LGSLGDGETDGGRPRLDQVDLLRFESSRRRLDGAEIAMGIVYVEDQLLAVLEAELPKTVPEPVDGDIVRWTALDDDADVKDAGVLRLGGERRDEEADCTSEQRTAVHY
jgi:hypothetical protein